MKEENTEDRREESRGISMKEERKEGKEERKIGEKKAER